MRARAAAALLAAGFLLTGCASAITPTDAPSAEQPPVEDGAEDAPVSEAPEECAVPFPQAFTEPDLADVASVPAGWPEPPAGSTLCLTASGVGAGAIETVSYAATADAEAILAHYEGALAGYTIERTDGPTGDQMLSGSGEDVGFQIQPGDGSFVIVFQADQ